MKTTSSILIVDDIEANRNTLELLLDFPEWDLQFAPDGPTALLLAERLRPDLVLLDVMMPGMDGFEVCARLRRTPQVADVPIIMVTSLDDRESKLRGIEAGADDFLTKPFDGVELRARVRGVLRLNRFRRMQEANEQLRAQAALIDLAPDAIIVCDLGQRITHWNPAAERMYGWRAEEAIGHRANELLLRDEGVDVPGGDAVASDVWQREVTHVTRERKELIVASHRKLLRNADGRPKAVLMINSDLTEKKRLEEQCFRAQRMESIGVMAGGIAHDLNNILAPILMNVELLRNQVRSVENHEPFEAIETCARRGAGLVRQILRFARGTGDQKAEIQLRRIVDGMVTMLRGAFPANIEVEVSLPKNLWPVFGNSTQLDQLVMNLCVNARDAMPDGGKLTISGENVKPSKNGSSSPNGAFVALTVADTGTGMSPEVKERIFETFYTTKEIGKGTGLGLATVKTIVEGHEGYISVESEPGCGARFTVHLPGNPLAEEALPMAEAQSEKRARGHGECILVVDDEPELLEVLATMLDSYGYRGLRAEDGLHALELFSEHGSEIQLVVTDSEMPQIGGAALAQILRGLDPELPILLTSGTQPDEQLIKRGCVTEFVRKPFAVAELVEAIQRNLDSSLRLSGDGSTDQRESGER